MMNIFLDEFLKEYSDKDILFVLDQAGWHKAKDIKVPPNATLLFLPAYLPELNRVEKLWQWLRKEATHNNLFKTLEEMMDEIKAHKILDAVRGMDAVDRDILSEILINVGKIGVENDTIKEIDINPVIISGSRPVAVDALIVLQPTG